MQGQRPRPRRRRRSACRLVLLASIACGGCGESSSGRGADAGGDASAAWFTEITDEAGLDFVHESGARGELHMPEVMGGGVALFDCEGDGDLDLFLVNGNGVLPERALDPRTTNRLYRQDGPGRFADATRGSGLEGGGFGMGAAIADADNDGDEDVYVTHFGPDRFHANVGGGRFEDATRAARIAIDGWSSSAGFLDYDRDGHLDLYVVQYVAFDPELPCYDAAGRPDYCGPKAFPPLLDVLLRNDGRGAFADVSSASGIASDAAAGLGLVSADFDEDGWQDVYVANDAYPNFLWMNRGDGTFVDQALVRGAAVDLNGQPRAGMGVVTADLDKSGALDLFVTNLRLEPNTLYLADGKPGSFRDGTGASGLGPASMPLTGFGTAAADFDDDEDLDIVVANGAVFHRPRSAAVALAPPWDEYAEPNLFFVNEGAARFREAGALAGDLCARIELSRGLATGDVDADGDLDVLIGHVAGKARLYRNDAPSRGHWLAVRCVHPGWKRDALGARVEVFYGGTSQVATIGQASSYLSSSPPIAHFGLGGAAAIERIEVRWPDGLLERFPGGPADRQLELRHGSGES